MGSKLVWSLDLPTALGLLLQPNTPDPTFTKQECRTALSSSCRRVFECSLIFTDTSLCWAALDSMVEENHVSFDKAVTGCDFRFYLESSEYVHFILSSPSLSVTTRNLSGVRLAVPCILDLGLEGGSHQLSIHHLVSATHPITIWGVESTQKKPSFPANLNRHIHDALSDDILGASWTRPPDVITCSSNDLQA